MFDFDFTYTRNRLWYYCSSENLLGIFSIKWGTRWSRRENIRYRKEVRKKKKVSPKQFQVVRNDSGFSVDIILINLLLPWGKMRKWYRMRSARHQWREKKNKQTDVIEKVCGDSTATLIDIELIDLLLQWSQNEHIECDFVTASTQWLCLV